MSTPQPPKAPPRRRYASVTVSHDVLKALKIQAAHEGESVYGLAGRLLITGLQERAPELAKTLATA